MTYARNDQVRAFIFENGANKCMPEPLYWPCMGVEAVKRSRGDVKIVECQDPNRYGEYVQVDGIPGQVGRWTSTLMSRLMVGEESPLEKLNRHSCTFDMHMNRGLCDIPTDLSQFAEMEVWEDVRITNYTTNPLSALSSDQRDQTTESVDISFRVRQKIYNLGYAFMSAPVEADTTPLAVEYVPSWCCSVGACKIAFFVTSGSVWYTFDGGLNWVQDTPDAGTPAGGFRVGGRFVALLSDQGIKLYSFGANGITSTLSTTIAGIGTITAFASNGRYGLFSDTLNLYTVNATGQITTVFDASGFAGVGGTLINKIAIDASGCAVVGFDNGNMMYSKDGSAWLPATVMPDAGAVLSIAAKSCANWLVGTDTGKVYCTDNSGLTYTKVFDNVTGDDITAIKALNDHVAYMVSGASLYRSVDGGTTWTLEPADPGRPFVTVTSIADISVCPDDINRLLFAVLDDNGARVVTGVPA